MCDPFSVDFDAALALERSPDGSSNDGFHGSSRKETELLVWSRPIGGRKLFELRTQPTARCEVHIRALSRIDRIARGYLVAFDRHMNVVLRDVDEVALPGRKEDRLFGRRKIQGNRLPPGMQWQPGGDWPRPLGECRTVLRRHLPCSMIKGDTVVLFRLLL
ncbi:LSM domain protein [Teladorsagia circumcincta]|uniref:LSM domain protein n=1 Tax=Teladorsagia circumcincta TaxID=45464 RepID=A0A2G9U5W6_TELCI|nr:LSM domain protein [Teladorsagia circumcincta]